MYKGCSTVSLLQVVSLKAPSTMSSAVLLKIPTTDLRRIIDNMPRSRDSANVVAPAASTRPLVGFRRVLLCCLAVFLVSLLFMSNRGDAITSVLPETYALCSRDAPTIYTVDDKNTMVQCLVVHGSRIPDTGSPGE